MHGVKRGPVDGERFNRVLMFAEVRQRPSKVGIKPIQKPIHITRAYNPRRNGFPSDGAVAVKAS